MDYITLDELDEIERQQGSVKPVSAGVTPEVADRLSTVSTIDRDNPDKETVRYKNIATFLGEKLMTETYRRQRERLAKDTEGGRYAKPDMGVIDTVGEYLRDIGTAWYEKTETFRREQAEGEEKVDVPNTVLGNIGYKAKEGEFSPLTERLVQTFNIENESEKRGLNTILNHNEGQSLKDLRDMVSETLDILNPTHQTSPTIFGDRGHSPIDVPSLIAESLLAAGIGSFISGEEGMSVASSAFTTLVDIVEKTSNLSREEALELTGEWVSTATVMVSNIASEIGQFTNEQITSVQRRSDPRGIVMNPIDVLPKEHYQSGISYWMASGAAIAESAIMNKVGTIVQLEQLKRTALDRIEHPIARKAIESVIDTLPTKSPLSYVDAEALDTLVKELDPLTGSLSRFTPGVAETRAFRSLEARKKGLGHQVVNEVTEAAFAFAGFLVELAVTRGVASKTALGRYIGGKPTVSARMSERLLRTTPGGFTHLTSDKVIRATTLANIFRNAAFVGVNRAMSTQGNFKDKAIAGALTTLYSSTPATTSMLLHKVGYTGSDIFVPIAVDFLSNTIITTGVSYAPMYNEMGGFTDDFIAAASVQLMFDLGMSLSTRAFLSSDKAVQTTMMMDEAAYDRFVARYKGNLNEIATKEEFVTTRMKQRAKLESVAETIERWEQRILQEATGARKVEGTPEIDSELIEVRGYRDPEVSRFQQREKKDAHRLEELYGKLSDLIDQRTALIDEMNRLEQSVKGDPQTDKLKKQISSIEGQETKIRNELDILERKGVPEETKKPEPVPEGESEERINSRARQRLLSIYKELKPLVKQEEALNKEIEKKYAEGKSARRLEKQQDALLNKIRDLQIERDVMISARGLPREVTREQFERAQLDSVEKQIRQFKAGLRAGEQITRKDIRAFQSYVQSVVKLSTGLTDKQKLSLTLLAGKVGTKEQLDKALSRIWNKVAELQKDNEKDLFVKASDRLLEKAKKKIKNRKFDPETAKVFTAAIKARNIQVTDRETFGQSTLDMVLYDISVLNRSHDLTAEQARAVYNDLKAVFDNGAATKEGMKVREKARKETLVVSALADLQGKDPSQPPMTDSDLKKAGKNVSIFAKIKLSSRRWSGLVTDLARRSEDKKGMSILERFTDMWSAERHSQNVKKEFQDLKLDMFRRVWGLKNKNEVHDKITKDLKDVIKITVNMEVKDPGSEEVTIVPREDDINRTVARQRWMEWQQPEGKKRLMKRSGYTEKTMKQIEDFLTAQDYDLIRELRVAYDALYRVTNEVYREVEGVDLPYRDSYSPFVPVKESGKDPDVSMLDLMNFDAKKHPTVEGKAHLKELSTMSRLDTIGDVFLYDRYVDDMSHYIGFAKTIKDSKTIFDDPRVIDFITKRDGKKILDTINVHLNTLSRGKLEASLNGLFSGLHKYISRVYMSTVGFDAKRIAIQLLSAGLYLTEMSGKEFAKGMLDLRRADKTGEIEVITKNPYMLERGVNPTRDMRMALDAVAEQHSTFQRKFIDNPRLNDMAMLMLKAGDRGAIILGAWGLYKHYTDKIKLDSVEALDRTLRFINDTQQSKDLSQMSSLLMDGNPFVRAITMYIHTPQQYVNNLWDALVSSGRISKAELAKTLVAYGTMSFVYSFIQNAGKLSLAGAATALLAGPVANGIPFVRDAVPPIVAAVFAQLLDEKQGASFSYSPIQNLSRDVISVINMAKEMAEHGVDADSVINLARSLGEASAPFTGALGAGVKATANIAKGIKYNLDYDDVGYMLMKFAGYTDGQLKDWE